MSDVANERILSRQEQQVGIRCESCHGTVDAYTTTIVAADTQGVMTDVAVDREGNPLRQVRRTASGDYFLTSKLTGNVHYVSQTRDVVVDNGKLDPLTNEPVYNSKASYAMGRADCDPSNGIGPLQTGGVTANFSHSDTMSCVSCHASWTNTCIGCHLKGEYDNGNNFSNITGERIVVNEANADFTYQNPWAFQLGVDAHGKISPFAANTEMFFQWFDRNGTPSDIFTFSNRNAQGGNPAEATHPALNHNAMMPHSIRGKVTDNDEGPRYCVACHLTIDALANYGTEYDAFRTAMVHKRLRRARHPVPSAALRGEPEEPVELAALATHGRGARHWTVPVR